MEQQKNQAVEVAIQKRQYSVADCILRDISLKEAVHKGVKKEQSLEITFKDDMPVIRRQNSFTFEDNEHLLEIKQTDFNDAASAKVRRQHNFHQRQELLKIRRKFNIQNFDKKCLLKIQKLQRRVREWIVKRQNDDMESACKTLHSAFMSDTFKIN